MRQYRAKREAMFKKTCTCGVEFFAKGPAGKYCPTCAPLRKKMVAENCYRNYAVKKGLNYGAGTGNHDNHPKGKDSACYSSGKNIWVAARKILLETIGHCERCKKDLRNALPSERCVHHKDHNKANNEMENFELLCKRCHQVEHEVWKNFSKV